MITQVEKLKTALVEILFLWSVSVGVQTCYNHVHQEPNPPDHAVDDKVPCKVVCVVQLGIEQKKQSCSTGEQAEHEVE